MLKEGEFNIGKITNMLLMQYITSYHGLFFLILITAIGIYFKHYTNPILFFAALVLWSNANNRQ